MTTLPIPADPTALPQADIGVIGLAVMGENLILNMANHGFTVAAFNRTVSKVSHFTEGRARGLSIIGANTLEELVGLLRRPRKVMLMVKAGRPVEEFIEHLRPLLEPGDILIDGGNSHPSDTQRRMQDLAKDGLLYVGTGVSGGEEGALTGPSIMPGGSPAAWPEIRPIFQAIAAKVADGTPCCDWVGEGGAGHFVKTVHNGIEYADMQMIAEAYHLLRDVGGLSAPEAADVFREWNAGELDSYLIEITADILGKTDDVTGQPLVDVILDTAGQKGTGKWTSVGALDAGAPAMTITQAVYARYMSALKTERVAASAVLPGPAARPAPDRATLVEQVRRALYASKIAAYAQGFQLMRMTAQESGWTLDYGSIARMWRGGCIIRAALLGTISDAFAAQAELPNLLLSPPFVAAISEHQQAWREVIALAALHGVPVPAFSSALAYYDSYRAARLPANLLQAQRDYFGAHTYERTDGPRGEFHHTNWTGRGGETASTTYNA
ncbi:decarboxylating NADP(+)-dependent phosphogluconate dehydrogenase [Deinococcus sp. KSM4-11]|uniref:decarboxylating NADP(+)-dependent phosphogluconate dehydrogenase n=1 Tax=Deinococcus sp. KSM4-11 TaxID=2568654 RepID=UPI0010A542C3|nr:decarboxylating NADP(+)-dependent phosphogluconate dehydrogenase [Deinococcus sp. KSM4-11]THF87086.1 decarboxylating NADP(+)-dependent phosphogluconate dehydrogenase [Deinococcus sp. KSM4-11]